MRKRNPPGKGRKLTCSKCDKLKERIGQAWCNNCIAAWARANRTRHSALPDEQRKRANARSYLNVYIKRGSIKKLPCSVCGEMKVEAHHSDHNKPLEVIWFCRKHHLEFHQNSKT